MHDSMQYDPIQGQILRDTDLAVCWSAIWMLLAHCWFLQGYGYCMVVIDT